MLNVRILKALLVLAVVLVIIGMVWNKQQYVWYEFSPSGPPIITAAPYKITVTMSSVSSYDNSISVYVAVRALDDTQTNEQQPIRVKIACKQIKLFADGVAIQADPAEYCVTDDPDKDPKSNAWLAYALPWKRPRVIALQIPAMTVGSGDAVVVTRPAEFFYAKRSETMGLSFH